MNYPYMLIMRNTPSGMVWQAYEVHNDKEVELLTKSARASHFCVSKELAGYTEETTPGWRDTQEWQDYSGGKLSERAKAQLEVMEVLKNIRRDGPYWLSGYNDWLVSCYSLRSLEDLHNFKPIACWSECSDNTCKQWLVCVKENKYYVDRLFGYDYGRGYGLKPTPIKEQDYPSHIFDWLKELKAL